jgi:hypothetical protein
VNFEPLGNLRSQALQHLLDVGLPLMGRVSTKLRVYIDQECLLGLALMLEPVLNLVEVDLLSLLEILMHAIFSCDIAEYRETLANQLSVKPVVGVKLIHVMNVVVGDVTGLDVRIEQFLDEIVNLRMQLLHARVKVFLLESLSELGAELRAGGWSLLAGLGSRLLEHFIRVVAELHSF